MVGLIKVIQILGSSMQSGDLVMFVWGGTPYPDKIGVIISEYEGTPAENGLPLKNVYWIDHQWVRPIKQEFLKVLSCA